MIGWLGDNAEALFGLGTLLLVVLWMRRRNGRWRPGPDRSPQHAPDRRGSGQQ